MGDHSSALMIACQCLATQNSCERGTGTAEDARRQFNLKAVVVSCCAGRSLSLSSNQLSGSFPSVISGLSALQ
jgi:hypothetical protein